MFGNLFDKTVDKHVFDKYNKGHKKQNRCLVFIQEGEYR